ncbi:MAG: PEGA domain-containing protein [Candidatus Micrarchaeota archaeon]
MRAIFAAIFFVLLISFSIADDLPALPNDAPAASSSIIPSAYPSTSASAQTMAMLDISSIPSGAGVTYHINGKMYREVGKTPTQLEVPAGKLLLELSLLGYQRFTREIATQEGKTEYIVASMEVVPSPTPTPSPSPIPTPTDYNCSQKTLAERVKCRIDLREDAFAEKNPFAPEECRLLEGSEEGECISSYARLKVCTQPKDYKQKEICAISYLRLRNPADEKAECEKKSAAEKADCIAQLRKKVYILAKFRIYSLEEQALKLLDKGVKEETVSDVIINLEQKKQRFNDANNLEQRKQAIWDAKKVWSDFKAKAIAQMRSANK